MKRLNKEQFLSLLADIINRVAKDQTYQGHITWEAASTLNPEWNIESTYHVKDAPSTKAHIRSIGHEDART